MKTIFRYTFLATLLAVVMAAGALATIAQDNCTDTAGREATDAEFRSALAVKPPTMESRKKAINAGKTYLEKYASCEGAADFATYLKTAVPKLEKIVADAQEQMDRDALAKRFIDGVTAKNWDDVYASGKALLAKDAEAYRPAELVLGSVGFDETQKNPQNTKYNEDTLKYARMSLADLESGKTFNTWGFGIYDYTIPGADKKADVAKSRDNAIGWMNYNIGFILSFDKTRNNKKEGVNYLYKATKSDGGTAKIPGVYRSIASYYIDEANKRFEEQKAAFEKAKNPPADATDADKEALAKDYEAKTGMFNATTELAIDAVARAYNIAKADGATNAASKAYAADQYKTLTDLYTNRFGNATGLDAYITQTLAKPFADPSAAIQPINDPKPAATTTGTSAPATPKATVPAKPAVPAAKPAVKPSTGVAKGTR